VNYGFATSSGEKVDELGSELVITFMQVFIQVFFSKALSQRRHSDVFSIKD
jgi:hypothetical protein